jgi:hypothetical protein
MPRQIRMPKPAPEATIVLGEGEDKRSFDLVARTSRIDDELDAIAADRLEAIKDLEATGESLSFRQLVEFNVRELDILTEPSGDGDEPISSVLLASYESGDASYSQISGLIDRIVKTQRPT